MKLIKIKPIISFGSIVVFAISLTACHCNGSKNSTTKTNVDTTAQPVIVPITNTAAFLKANKMVMATYTEIPENETDTVIGSSVYYPTLTMKKGSKLIIPTSLGSCNILIGKASFDDNTQIIADGKSGGNGANKPGDPWNTGWWQAANEGEHGAKGVDGGDGIAGTDGLRNVNIRMGLIKLHRLYIHANGGNGGNGGDGGGGQVGGNKQGVTGSNGDGGNGGNGGAGQDGGSGGANLSVGIWQGTGSIDLPGAMQRLSVLSEGGKGGKSGNGGVGSGAGNNSGLYGAPGSTGRAGNDGVTYPTRLAVIPKPPLP